MVEEEIYVTNVDSVQVLLHINNGIKHIIGKLINISYKMWILLSVYCN